jgi:hypothetical protein
MRSWEFSHAGSNIDHSWASTWLKMWLTWKCRNRDSRNCADIATNYLLQLASRSIPVELRITATATEHVNVSSWSVMHWTRQQCHVSKGKALKDRPRWCIIQADAIHILLFSYHIVNITQAVFTMIKRCDPLQPVVLHKELLCLE